MDVQASYYAAICTYQGRLYIAGGKTSNSAIIELTAKVNRDLAASEINYKFINTWDLNWEVYTEHGEFVRCRKPNST